MLESSNREMELHDFMELARNMAVTNIVSLVLGRQRGEKMNRAH